MSRVNRSIPAGSASPHRSKESITEKAGWFAVDKNHCPSLCWQSPGRDRRRRRGECVRFELGLAGHAAEMLVEQKVGPKIRVERDPAIFEELEAGLVLLLTAVLHELITHASETCEQIFARLRLLGRGFERTAFLLEEDAHV